MPEIDSLTVRIEADLSGLRRGLREAEQIVGQSSQAMIRSLGEVEDSLSKIGARVATVPTLVSNPERRITPEDRAINAVTGASIAGTMLGLASAGGPVPIGTAVAALIAGAILGALVPEIDARLSKALLEPLSGEPGSRSEQLADRIANLDRRIDDQELKAQTVGGIAGQRAQGFADQARNERNRLLAEQRRKEFLEGATPDAQKFRSLERRALNADFESAPANIFGCIQRICDNLESLGRQRSSGKVTLGAVDGDGISGSDSVETLIGDAGEDAVRAKDRIEEISETFEGARISAIGFAVAQFSALDVVVRKSEEARVSAQNLNGAARDLGFTLASSFEDAVVEGRRLSDVLQGLEQDILRILTRKLVTEPLAGALTGLIGSGLGVLSGEFHGSGRVGSTAVSGRVVPASLFGGAPRFTDCEFAAPQIADWIALIPQLKVLDMCIQNGPPAVWQEHINFADGLG